MYSVILHFTSLVYGDEANLLCYQEYSDEKLQELKSLMMAEVTIYLEMFNMILLLFVFQEVPEFEDKQSTGVLIWLGESIGKPLSSVFSI